MKNLHFGAGNIGRGFIGQLLNKSNYHITFVDINEAIVKNLKTRDNYTISILDKQLDTDTINNFSALNISTEKDAISEQISKTDLITTSIGPTILPIIAKDIANGLKLKFEKNNTNLLDIIACENMIEGSSFLKEEIFKYLTSDEQKFVETHVGFPNSAVDRIVPAQKHEDVLFVEVERFCEWVIEENSIKLEKNKNIIGATYVNNLMPYIERKLFTVNTGHAALSYIGNYLGINLVSEAAKDERVRSEFIKVLEETSNLLVNKWNFSTQDMKNYRTKTISRFENPYIVDNVERICRTPIRKLGFNERFIKPIRECSERNLQNESLIKACAYILTFFSNDDEQSIELRESIIKNGIVPTLEKITELSNIDILNKIELYYNEL